MKNAILILVLSSLSTLSFSQKTESINSIKQLTDSIGVIIKQENITGLMLGITTKDSVIFSGGFGYSDLEAKRKGNESTLFRMGSITKMFVSLAIMKLVNEGKLKLDDELKKIAPEVPFQNKWESTNPVRIVHLLEHTSAFDDIKLNRMYCLDAKENTGIDMMLVHKNSMICRWKPGERFAYSNPNYAILGYIIEKISGEPYSEYLTENILTPQSIDKKAIEPFLGRYQFASPRNEISAFSDKVQNAPKIYLKDGRLYFKPLIGDPSELLQTGPMTFAGRGMNMPLICFTKNDNGKNVMMIAGAYYEQTSNFWAMLKRVIIIMALVFALSSVILGIASLIGIIIGKLTWRDIIPRVIPMIGLGLFVWAVFNLLEVQNYTYKLAELDTINLRTMVIFSGTSALGIASIVSLFLSIRMFRKMNKRWFAYYFLLTTISFFFIAAILWQNSWIGLRTWAL